MKARDVVLEWLKANAPEHAGKADHLLRYLSDNGYIVVRSGDQSINRSPPSATIGMKPMGQV